MRSEPALAAAQGAPTTPPCRRHPAHPAEPRRQARLQRLRRSLQFAFFALFLLAPALNLLRFDLTETQLWVLGFRWSLGIDAFLHGQASATQAALSIILRGILPVLAVVATVLAVAYRYGRLYCGWLCPHFTMVEALNGLLHRAIGRFSLWDAQPTAHGGSVPQRRWWPVFIVSCAFFGFLWAITLLTYLLPPAQIWGNLVHGTLTPNQGRFLLVFGTIFTLEAALARHLFCRYACAAGLFQSLAWMANPRALVVSFDRSRTRDCRSCSTAAYPQGNACDSACPMRLRPRSIKRLMFTCVQCGQCVDECEASHAAHQRTPNLEWKVGLDALRESLRQRRES